jgi:hypothetical protein
MIRMRRTAMTRYIVVNEHTPEQCGPMERDMDKIPDRLRGLDFLCTCPGGVHGYYMVMEGDSAEDVLKALPESLRLGATRAQSLEIFKL